MNHPNVQLNLDQRPRLLRKAMWELLSEQWDVPGDQGTLQNHRRAQVQTPRPRRLRLHPTIQGMTLGRVGARMSRMTQSEVVNEANDAEIIDTAETDDEDGILHPRGPPLSPYLLRNTAEQLIYEHIIDSYERTMLTYEMEK